MKKGKILFLASALTLTLTACDKDDDEGNNNNNGTETSNTQDVNFALQASFANQAEIAAGNIASQRATNAGVMSFAQMMVTDHSTAQTQLQTAANNARLSINADTSSFAAVRQQLLALSGRAFDSTYITMQVAGHQATLAQLQAEANNGASPSLKAYATQQIPHVTEHLRVADSLRLHL
ncbi:MAG: DUF4142 domain-containing protein [Chitinophagaceae bacterium]|nr:MAG: DUF4142 domain-containing protein [Chitinophagaceae bacterium]